MIITNDGNERRICDDSEPAAGATEVQITAPIATFLAARPARAELSKAQLRRVLSRVKGVADLCGAGGAPMPPLMEVSLNNMLVANFLRNEAREGMMIGKCRDTTMPVGKGPDTDKQAAQKEKEIAVRVSEAPLGSDAVLGDDRLAYAVRESGSVQGQRAVGACDTLTAAASWSVDAIGATQAFALRMRCPLALAALRLHAAVQRELRAPTADLARAGRDAR